MHRPPVDRSTVGVRAAYARYPLAPGKSELRKRRTAVPASADLWVRSSASRRDRESAEVHVYLIVRLPRQTRRLSLPRSRLGRDAGRRGSRGVHRRLVGWPELEMHRRVQPCRRRISQHAPCCFLCPLRSLYRPCVQDPLVRIMRSAPDAEASNSQAALLPPPRRENHSRRRITMSATGRVAIQAVRVAQSPREQLQPGCSLIVGESGLLRWWS